MFPHKVIISFGLLSLSFWTIQANLDEFIRANHLFTADIYKKVVNKDKNFVVSPVFIQIILNLIRSGAGGDTAKEIQTVLHHNNITENIEPLVKYLIDSIKTQDKYNLQLSNKLYVSKGILIKNEFRDTATKVYHSEIENINFLRPVQVVLNIDKWLNKNSILEDTRSGLLSKIVGAPLLFINTVNFKANWSEEFYPVNSTFYSKGGEALVSSLIGLGSRNIYYDKELDATFLEISFKGNASSLVIVLPRKKDGLTKLEKQVEKVFTAKPKYRKELTLAFFPKFEFENRFYLSKSLKDLGINTLFSKKANLSKIAEFKNLYASELLHGAAVGVDLSGTRAAALPKVPSGRSNIPIVAFEVVHPFLFYIKIKDYIAFAGHFVSPH